jgi:hypothetical protein
VLKRLNQPFPDKDSLQKSLLTIFWVGIFVALFLLLIRPFSIEGEWADLAIASAGFGAVTVVFGWIFELSTRYVFRIKTYGPSWTLGKWILTSIVLVVWIALGNYLFVNWLSGWKAMGYFNFVRMIGYTSLIGIFPVVLSGVVIQLRETQKNEESATDISENLRESIEANHTVVVLEPESGNELKLDASAVRYVEAMQNYVTVWYMSDGKLAKEMLRSTLSATEKQFLHSDVIRCHRSYLVNVDSIESVSGNAQGLRLKLQNVTDLEIPVSRSFIPRIRELLG